MFDAPSALSNALAFKMFYQVWVICQFCCGGWHPHRSWGRFRGFHPFPLSVALVISCPFCPRHTTYCSIVGAHVCVALSCLLRVIMLFCLSSPLGFRVDQSSRCSIMFRAASKFHWETVLRRRNAWTMRTFPTLIDPHLCWGPPTRNM